MNLLKLAAAFQLVFKKEWKGKKIALALNLPYLSNGILNKANKTCQAVNAGIPW